MIKNMTNVRGIKCWGAHTGIKSMKRDLAIIYSDAPASVAAVFTQNEVIAEPIKVSKKHIKNGIAQAIVINAGNANACTGKQGLKGAEAMAETLAEELNIEKEMVIVASTGLIGEPFPTEEIIAGIRENVKKLSKKSNAGSFVANAILTTDTFPKEGFVEFDMDGYEINMGGIAKGSGMIHPNMATMLAFVVTDVAIEPKLLQKMLKEIVDKSFNMITVDGDTSTNDMVAVLANGKAQNEMIKSKKDKGYLTFKTHLEEMMIHLAKLIISDGEGSSKFIEYVVVNAPKEEIARKLIRGISDSLLVKTAMYGRDPNWGRIISAAGNSGVPFNYMNVDLYIGNENKLIKVLEQGAPQEYDRKFMKKLLRESHLEIKLDLKNGKACLKGWGSDLTTDYVQFNSVYTT
ncbi:MAG: bifunctional glutamate N-acetyltransferase/amino-acid acetyltransferase ArgJ [candidate division Zixibacteria bacterium]|nr:bifunctional glutamate N-acetyltransferase/amino-acid acetyltransferase ArgJ [candidate division Zixibacteria bacterium]